MNNRKYYHMLSEHPDLIAVAPPPPGNMAWSGSNNLGNVVPFAPTADNSQSILRLDEWGPPEMWTISLAIDDIGDWSAFNSAVPELDYNATPIALISYGAGGTTIDLEVDWRNGTQFSVPMNAIDIACEWTAGSSTGVLAAPPGLRISALLGRGSCVGHATRTLTVQDLNNNGPQLLEIPPFTKELELYYFLPSIIPVVATTGLVIGSFYTGTGMANAQTVLFAADFSNRLKIPVTPGCRYVYVSDTAVAPNRTKPFQIIAHLGL